MFGAGGPVDNERRLDDDMPAGPDEGTPPLVELGEPQPVEPVPPGREGDRLPEPVAVTSLEVALGEETVTVVTSSVVRSVICVVDSFVAIVVMKLLVNVVGRRVVEIDTGAEGETVVRVSTTVLVRSVISYVEEFVAIVVTRVLVVVTGSVMLTGIEDTASLGE